MFWTLKGSETIKATKAKLAESTTNLQQDELGVRAPTGKTVSPVISCEKHRTLISGVSRGQSKARTPILRFQYENKPIT